jgi:hypothetical protein
MEAAEELKPVRVWPPIEANGEWQRKHSGLEYESMAQAR